MPAEPPRLPDEDRGPGAARPWGYYEFAGLRLDPPRRLVSRLDGTPVGIAGKSFDALVFLVEHAGELVTREALTAALWPRTIVEDSNLNVAISTLRRVLRDAVPGERFIVTVAGRGYQFVAPVRTVDDTGAPPEVRSIKTGSPEPPEPPERPAVPAAAGARRPGRRAAAIGIAAALAVGAAALVALLRAPGVAHDGPGELVSAFAPSASTRRRPQRHSQRRSRRRPWRRPRRRPRPPPRRPPRRQRLPRTTR
ncbi:MAG: transcriptional regulator [Lautropia sp.]